MVLHVLPFFLAVITIVLHQLVGIPTSSGVMLPLFTSSKRACPTGSLKWKGTGIGFMPGFKDCSLIKVDVGSRARHGGGECPIVFKYHFGEMLEEPILELIDVCFYWGKKKGFLDALAVDPYPHQVWSWHLCLLRVYIALQYFIGLVILLHLWRFASLIFWPLHYLRQMVGR